MRFLEHGVVGADDFTSSSTRFGNRILGALGTDRPDCADVIISALLERASHMILIAIYFDAIYNP